MTAAKQNDGTKTKAQLDAEAKARAKSGVAERKAEHAAALDTPLPDAGSVDAPDEAETDGQDDAEVISVAEALEAVQAESKDRDDALAEGILKLEARVAVLEELAEGILKLEARVAVLEELVKRVGTGVKQSARKDDGTLAGSIDDLEI